MNWPLQIAGLKSFPPATYTIAAIHCILTAKANERWVAGSPPPFSNIPESGIKALGVGSLISTERRNTLQVSEPVFSKAWDTPDGRNATSPARAAILSPLMLRVTRRGRIRMIFFPVGMRRVTHKPRAQGSRMHFKFCQQGRWSVE